MIILQEPHILREWHVWVFISVSIHHLQHVVWADQSTVLCYTCYTKPKAYISNHCAWDIVPLAFSAVQMQYHCCHV